MFEGCDNCVDLTHPHFCAFFDVLSLKSESGHCTASLATLLDIAFVSESLDLVETKTDLTRRCKERNLQTVVCQSLSKRTVLIITLQKSEDQQNDWKQVFGRYS